MDKSVKLALEPRILLVKTGSNIVNIIGIIASKIGDNSKANLKKLLLKS